MPSITSPVAKEKISDVVFLVFGFSGPTSNPESHITFICYVSLVFLNLEHFLSLSLFGNV